MKAENEFLAVHNALNPSLRELWLGIGRSMAAESAQPVPLKGRPLLRLIPGHLGADENILHRGSERNTPLLIRKPVGGQ